ncbi:hypothetical protein XELAEV_18010832mg [Xenopus laevis]|uniref:Uncharacterized protein n=1 Tax=Xenopus laevis TaxID=8355 RepID=A0A974I269_XENLA|nr:hypothetical protein XELAEV_18010832mg [Xenopus laevis]
MYLANYFGSACFGFYGYSFVFKDLGQSPRGVLTYNINLSYIKKGNKYQAALLAE